ncbi:hypothetical protein ACFQGT_16495 [Natrialbaceae archaeon GCM10025810]|uniref:hypothetical protein n=1 Tax=Halovalidus salilacus TaxID=3075124 RepID=UPI00361ADC53
MTRSTVSSNVPGALERATAGLAPAVREAVVGSVPPPDRSVPATLCRTVADAIAIDPPTEGTLESLAEAVVSLEGYARLRADLLSTDRYGAAAERDVAVLASDYLYAAAYAPLADADVAPDRVPALYRTLTVGSETIVRRFSDGASRSPVPSSEPSPSSSETPAATNGTTGTSDYEVTLAGLACELGATAVGATGSTRRAVRRYGESLAAALAAIAPPSPAEGDPRATAIRVLSGSDDAPARIPARGAVRTAAPDRDGSTSTSTSTSSVDRHLETARRALQALTASDEDDSSAVGRLERATRIPFERERVDRDQYDDDRDDGA